jgi:hypothetical protein
LPICDCRFSIASFRLNLAEGTLRSRLQLKTEAAVVGVLTRFLRTWLVAAWQNLVLLIGNRQSQIGNHSGFRFGLFSTTRLSVTEKTFGTELARVRMRVSSNWLSTTPSSVTWPLSTMM